MVQNVKNGHGITRFSRILVVIYFRLDLIPQMICKFQNRMVRVIGSGNKPCKSIDKHTGSNPC